MLPLLEIERVQDLSHDARSEWAWGTDEGLVALHTSPNGCNAGRKYCLQVLIRGPSVCGVASASAEPLTRFSPFQMTGVDLKRMHEHVFQDGGDPETTFSARQLTPKVTDAVLCQHVRRDCALRALIREYAGSRRESATTSGSVRRKILSYSSTALSSRQRTTVSRLRPLAAHVFSGCANGCVIPTAATLFK